MLNLLAILCICMGLGVNSNPIYNTEKEEAPKPLIQRQQINQELNINLTNSQESNNNYINVPGVYNSNEYRFRIYNRKYNISGNNNAMTVVGTSYDIKARRQVKQVGTDNWQNASYMIAEGNITQEANYDIVSEDYLSQFEGSFTRNLYASQLYALAITPYNYNIETTVRVRLYVSTNVINYGSDIVESRMRTHVYSGTDNGLANYIGLQQTTTTVKDIIRDIQDVNTGYYYNEKIYDTLIENSSIERNDYYEYDIQIAPGKTNYYFIYMTPYAIFNPELKPTQTDGVDFVSGSPIAPSTTSSIKISTVNIIPEGNIEVIDLPGIMLEILTMPFTFVSTAFNLTLFPGTPYQINITNLFLAIFAVLIFIMILKLILKIGNK